MIVSFYEKENGERPALDFIKSLPKKLKEKTYLSIYKLEKEGHNIRYPYSEKLTDNIFELRTKFGSDITRVLYFFYDGDKAILTNGFIKKTQKTPKEEIKKAEKLRKEYYERKTRVHF